MVSLIKDPSPDGPTTGSPDAEGRVIYTDMYNEIADRLGLPRPTGNRVVITTAAGLYDVSVITDVKLGYLTDVTSNLQAQLDNKASLITNNNFGAFYEDHAGIATPANPGAGTRRIFVDSGTNKLSVRTSGGTTVSLEEQGSGGEANTASNVGTGAGVFKQKVGVDLEFKSFIGETNRLVITSNASDLTLTVGTEVLLTNVDQTITSAKTWTIADTTNKVPITINQNDITNNPRGISIINAGTAASLFVDPNGATSTSTSVGGAILLENTGNNGAGFILYSNAGASATGRLMNIRADNSLFANPCLHIDNDGIANAVEIVQNGVDASANALNVVSINDLDTCVGISGQESGKGTVKITHTKPVAADTNASALSISLEGVGTAAQGLFIDSPATTTGKLVNIRNNAVEYVTITNGGDLVLRALTKLYLDGVAGAGGDTYLVESAANIPRISAGGNFVDFDLAGATAATKAVLDFNQTVDRTYTFPNATGTVIITGLANQITDTEIAAHTSTKITITTKGQLNSAIVYNDQTNAFGDFEQSFKDNQLKIFNPADTFKYIITAGAITVADRILNLPVITGTDTLAVLLLAQTLEQKTLGTGTIFSVIPTINDGITFTFNPSATVAGINVGALSGDPSSPVNADIWYDSTANKFRARENGTSKDLIGGAGSNEFADNLFRIIGSGDSTKKLAFEVDGITTATTRTWTVPNADSTFAGLSIANVFTANQEVEKTGAIPTLTFDRPEVVVDATQISEIISSGFSDSSVARTYSAIRTYVVDDVNLAEDGELRIAVIRNGTVEEFIRLNNAAGNDIEIAKNMDMLGNRIQMATSAYLQQTSVSNVFLIGDSAILGCKPASASGVATFMLRNGNDEANTSYMQFGATATFIGIISGQSGSGTLLPMEFRVGGASPSILVLTTALDVVLKDGSKLYFDGSSGVGGDTYLDHSAANRLRATVGGQTALDLVQNGSLVNVVSGVQAILSTTATDGFLYIPYMQGVATGVPTAYTGKSAIAYDETNNQLVIRDVAEGVWKTIGGGGSHALLSATHSDTVTQTVSRGSLVVGKTATPVWDELVIGGANTILASDGTDAIWTTLAKAHLPASIAYEDEANIFTQNQRIAKTGDYIPFTIYRNEIVADGAFLSSWETHGQSDTGVERVYGAINTYVIDDVNTAEDGGVEYEALTAGSLDAYFILNELGANNVKFFKNVNINSNTITNAVLGSGSSMNLTNVAISGTKAQFDAALSNDNFAYIGQANVFTQNQQVERTGAIPTLELDRPEVLADTTTLGALTFNGFSSTSVARKFAEIRSSMEDDTNTTEDGGLVLSVMQAGTLTDYLTINEGINTKIKSYRNFEIERTGTGALLQFDRPEVVADNSVLGSFTFEGLSSTSVPRTYVEIMGIMADDTNTTEDGELQLRVIEAGSMVNYIRLNNAVGLDIDMMKPVNFNAQALSGILSMAMSTDTAHTIDDTAAILRFNVPTGDTFAFRINAVDELTLSASALDLQTNWLDMSEQAVPATPAANQARIYAFDEAGFSEFAYKNDNGRISYLQDAGAWRLRRPLSIFPSPITISTVSTTGPISSGIVALTGTWTGVTGDADGPRRNLPTASTNNSESGFDFLTTPSVRSAFNIDITIKCKIISTAVRRFWFGFFTATPMASDAPTAVHWGIRLSTAAGSTQFVLSTADGTAQSEVNLLASDAAIHTIRLITDNANSRVGASIDGAAITWKTTNYPTSTTNVGLVTRLRTLEAVAKNWDWSWCEGSIDK